MINLTAKRVTAMGKKTTTGMRELELDDHLYVKR